MCQPTLDGWVEQPSPCCAAASIAGAFNALQRIKSADDPRAIRPDRVLPILQQLITAELHDKKATCARAINLPGAKGIEPLGLLMKCVEKYQQRKGRPLTGRKENSVSAKELRHALREIVHAGPADAECRALCSNVSERDELALWQRLRWSSDHLPDTTGGAKYHSNIGVLRPAPIQRRRIVCGDSNNQCSSHTADTTTTTTAPPPPSSAYAYAPAAASPNELPPLRGEDALLKLSHAYVGWCKIIDANLPSTSAVGNTHILQTAQTLTSELELPVRGRRFCSLKEKTTPSDGYADLPVEEYDTPDQIESQWRRLWSAFEEADSVLLFHFFNHYALGYAMREWRDSTTGELQREILTAKPAQRPCRWLPWNELRRWLLQWQGYAVFKFEIHREPAELQLTTTLNPMQQMPPPQQRGVGVALSGVGAPTALPPSALAVHGPASLLTPPPQQQVPLVSYPFAALSTYAPPLPLPQQDASGANSAAMRAHARYAGGGGRGGRGSASGAAMRAQGKGGGAVFVR